jgi:polyhydroxyalkanoate synthesis regulator phasin
MIFERIAAYEASFGRNATGTRMAKFLSYLSEPEKEVLRLMNLDRVTDPDRLEQIRVEEEGRQTYFGEAYVPYRNLTLFTYKTPAFATGWVKEADVSDLTVEAAAAKMMSKPTGQVAIRKYDLEIIHVLRRRFMLNDFASIKKAYEDVQLSSPEDPGRVEDKMIDFVSKVVDVNRQVDASALSTESLEAIIKALNEKISAHAVTLAGYMADMTERKNSTISQWATVLMQKVTDAAMHADVFTGYNNSSAEVEMLRQQVRDLERAAGQQQRQPRDQTQPPEHRFNGVCNNCNGYGHLARDCTATRRPDSSGKGSGRGGHQGVQPTGRGGHQGVQPAGKGGGGKGDAGGRGRGRAVAAVNNSAPGPHGPNLTDAQFDKWLLTQRP